MASEQIAVAGIQIAQVMGSREANISTAIEAISAAPEHDIYGEFNLYYEYKLGRPG